MTINIDSLWVLLGIGMVLGSGIYLGVLYTVLVIRAVKVSGIWIADRIVIPTVNRFQVWRGKWKA